MAADPTPTKHKEVSVVGEVDGEYRIWADSLLVGFVNNSDMNDEEFRVDYYQALAHGQTNAYEYLKKYGRVSSKQSKAIPHKQKPVQESRRSVRGTFEEAVDDLTEVESMGKRLNAEGYWRDEDDDDEWENETRRQGQMGMGLTDYSGESEDD